MSDSSHWSKDLTFKLAVGAYHQPPFYRELRNLEGEINTSVRAQKSVHILGGIVWDFSWYKRKFKLISELYYKHQWDLIPYDVDNVRIRYYGDNLAKGYVTGWDFRLNGELVKGLESWVNFSLLRARESFDDVEHKVYTLEGQTVDTSTVEYVSKPTDQLFIFSMYFQDELPGPSGSRSIWLLPWAVACTMACPKTILWPEISIATRPIIASILALASRFGIAPKRPKKPIKTRIYLWPWPNKPSKKIAKIPSATCARPGSA